MVYYIVDKIFYKWYIARRKCYILIYYLSMAKNLKSRETLKTEIIDRLQSDYYVTDRELTSGSLFLHGPNVLPGEIAVAFYARYRRVPPQGKEFSNWEDFIETLLDLLFAKK